MPQISNIAVRFANIHQKHTRLMAKNQRKNKNFEFILPISNTLDWPPDLNDPEVPQRGPLAPRLVNFAQKVTPEIHSSDSSDRCCDWSQQIFLFRSHHMNTFTSLG